MSAVDGRRHCPTLVAPATESDDGRVQLRSPGVGTWHPAAPAGQLVRPGEIVGELHILGTAWRVVAGTGTRGAIAAVTGEHRARTPVDHGAVLYVLDPNVGMAAATGDDGPAATRDAALAFRAPSSGRFYSRPGPDKPAFVTVGEIVKTGQTVCMLEVMKTFHRIAYGGPGLPDAARVTAIAIGDESDVEPGAVILYLEAVR